MYQIFTPTVGKQKSLLGNLHHDVMQSDLDVNKFQTLNLKYDISCCSIQ